MAALPLILSNLQSVVRLLFNVYSSYTQAPDQFRNFSQEIKSLQAVYSRVSDLLGSQDSTPTLSGKDIEGLETLNKGLQTLVKELNALLEKYQGLEDDPRLSVNRATWGLEDLAGFRKRIRVHVSLLTVFNTNLVWYVCFPLEFLTRMLFDNSYALRVLVWFLKLKSRESRVFHFFPVCKVHS